DRNRPTPLDAVTVDRLARDYHALGNQYAVFSDSRVLGEKSIVQFLDTATAIGKSKDPAMHMDIAGSFQSLVGLWQILVRQGSIPESQADAVFSGIVGGFAGIKSDRDLFDAGRKGVNLLLGQAAPGPETHGKLLDLVAGKSGETETHDQVVQDMMRILEAQRII